MNAEWSATIVEQCSKILSDIVKVAFTPTNKHVVSNPIKYTKIEQKPDTQPQVITMKQGAAVQKAAGTPTEDEIAYRWECCVTPGTMIYGANGIEQMDALSDINHNNGVYSALTHTGKLMRANTWMQRHYTGKLVNLDFYYTNIPLRLTPEHKLLGIADLREPQSVWRFNGNTLPNEDNINWYPSSDFTKNSFVSFPRITDTVDIDTLSPELCEFIGWYVAEGSIDKIKNDITISLGFHEKDNILRVKYLIEHLFGIVPSEYVSTANRICFTCDPIAELLKQFGLGATHKRLPQWFIKLPANKQFAFLKGYILGDGGLYVNRISATTSSETLAYHLRLLLFRLGILHSISRYLVADSVINGRIIHATQPRNNITISGDAARILSLNIGLKYECGNRTSGNFGYVGNNYILLPVRKFGTEPYDGMVYNAEIDTDNSYLTIHGAVHNCCKHLGGASILMKEAYERAIGDDGIGPGTAEKVMSALNEHSGMEDDINPMLTFAETHDEAVKLLDATRKFRRAAWDCKITTGGGTIDDIEAAKMWNDLMYQQAFENAKKHPGVECVASGM